MLSRRERRRARRTGGRATASSGCFDAWRRTRIDCSRWRKFLVDPDPTSTGINRRCARTSGTWTNGPRSAISHAVDEVAVADGALKARSWRRRPAVRASRRGRCRGAAVLEQVQQVANPGASVRRVHAAEDGNRVGHRQRVSVAVVLLDGRAEDGLGRPVRARRRCVRHRAARASRRLRATGSTCRASGGRPHGSSRGSRDRGPVGTWRMRSSRAANEAQISDVPSVDRLSEMTSSQSSNV